MKTRTTKIIYWSGVIFMSLWFGASGFFELTKNPIVWDITRQLGYPPHFIYILGVFKLSGVVVLLLPNKLLKLKEWVFAGMFFDIIFAFFSKIAVLGFPATIDAIIAFSVLTVTYLMFKKLYSSEQIVDRL
ncbi:DoxX family protein [Chryseobacterium sp. BIGb0232]|uniref:DoxX family protein n=1 Tax=Chryseobacterium sp. BIGb0232 TaxID=2940598 RepID=UPI000F48BAE6|nr:DoxX family protein [Chryseobacterium sp. BIGb0232]MCS4300749.1 putative membrane protein YphA (DoxX/SURF4 family) [Chryseobacterium sp. BIGb0232]ROS20371.1 DoxX-like protein [Chryseobacterium nakagawai]